MEMKNGVFPREVDGGQSLSRRTFLRIGAILQVVYEVTRFILADNRCARQGWANRATLGGLAVGIAFMYFTAFLVKF